MARRWENTKIPTQLQSKTIRIGSRDQLLAALFQTELAGTSLKISAVQRVENPAADLPDTRPQE